MTPGGCPDCDPLNGYICPSHCKYPDLCQPRDHGDLCYGQMPASRAILSNFWQRGINVTPDIADRLGAMERSLR